MRFHETAFYKMKRANISHYAKKTTDKTKKAIRKILKKDSKMDKDIEQNEKVEEQKTDKKTESQEENPQTKASEAESGEASDKEGEAQGLEAKLEELNKKYLLLYSDFENYRRRTAKEKMELVLNAAESTIKDLLPIVDDYERALANMESTDNELMAKTREGMELIYNKLMDTLSRKGLKPIGAKGEKFDESLHEAIARIPASKEEEKGIVVDETTKGYYLNDKVIRYSKVVVAM